MSKLKIDDILYRYVSAFPSVIFEFKVIGLHQYKDITQYHMKSQTCNDHTPCEILVVEDDYNNYSFVKMVNNNGFDDDCQNEDQRHWHTDGEHLYKVREQAILKKMEKIRTDMVDTITKAENKLNYHELELKKIDEYIDEYNLVLNKIEEG